MIDFPDGWTPEQVARFIERLRNGPPIPRIKTPLFDRIAKQPSRHIVHKWPKL